MLKRSLSVIVALVGMAISAQAGQWEIDKPHSSIQFKVSHLVISRVVGEFQVFSANLDFDGKDVSTGKVEMTISVASVNTENENRDKHLRSADFFDAEKYPEITFKTRKVIKGEGKKFQLVGDMTMKDVTKEVTFECEYHGSVELGGTKKAGFTATTTIDRQEFGVSYSKVIDNGGLVAGNEVEITLELEFNEIG